VLHIPRNAAIDPQAVLDSVVNPTTKTKASAGFNKPGGASWMGGNASDVMACNFSKDVDGAVGTLSLMLKPRPGGMDYLNTVFPGDLLAAFMSDSGDYDPANRASGTFVTFVIIDSVRQLTAVENGGAVVNTVSITARDMGVVFSETACVNDQAFQQLDNLLFSGDYLKQLYGKSQLALSPLENILLLLRIFYDSSATKTQNADGTFASSTGVDLQWKLDNTRQLASLIDVTSFVQVPIFGYRPIEPAALIQYGNLWSAMEAFSNPVLNEMFVDVRDLDTQNSAYQSVQASFVSNNETFVLDDVRNQQVAVNDVDTSGVFNKSAPGVVSTVALVLRERPFDDAVFSALPTSVVESTEIDNSEISRSSHDVFNWFRLRLGNADVKLQEILEGVGIVPDSVARFGFRRMDAETQFMFTSSKFAVDAKGGAKIDFTSVYEFFVDKLGHWYGGNENFLAGGMTVRFRPDIRVGTRLEFRRGSQKLWFYVQGVNHSFSKDPGRSRTQLTLTRGRDDSGLPEITLTTFQHDQLKQANPTSPSASPSASPTNLAPRPTGLEPLKPGFGT
jgi:hypothetical protein